MAKCADWFIQNNAPTVEDFLKLDCSLAALMCGKIGFSSHINGVHIGPVVTVNRWQTKLIRSSRGKNVNRLLWASTAKRNLCPKSALIIEPHDGVFREPLSQFIRQCLRSIGVPCKSKGQSHPIIHISPGRTSPYYRGLAPCIGCITEQGFSQGRYSIVSGCKFVLPGPRKFCSAA